MNCLVARQKLWDGICDAIRSQGLSLSPFRVQTRPGNKQMRHSLRQENAALLSLAPLLSDCDLFAVEPAAFRNATIDLGVTPPLHHSIDPNPIVSWAESIADTETMS